MSEANQQESSSWPIFHFGLIVTGKGEEDHLPKLFRSLAIGGGCRFSVIRRIGQRNPIKSPKRKLDMVGNGKTIPDRDAMEIGLPARRFLWQDKFRFILLIDDLESGRRDIKQGVFDRYRRALDTMLVYGERNRAAVFFLVNMLEAYYFADAAAVNAHLRRDPPLEEYEGDVETIGHPKNELKEQYPGFREREDAGPILAILDVEHVLDRPDTCASLRSIFAWCVRVLRMHPHFDEMGIARKFRLVDGEMDDVTRAQIDAL